MNERSYNHIHILLNQKRYLEAEKLIAEHMSQDVDNNSLRYMLAIVKIQNNKLEEAKGLLLGLLSEEVDPDYIFYLAEIDNLNEQYSSGERKLREAISLDPDADNYICGLAQNLYLQKRFDEAIKSADIGLEINPENIDLANIRAACLMKTGKKDQAYESLDITLERDPENSNTHATYAWSLLHQGKNKEALTHFQTALSINPGSLYAQQGILEAMKSKFWLYRSFLRVMLWMSKFTGGKQWAIIIGAYIFMRMLSALVKKYPELSPVLIPIIVLIALLFMSTWIIRPLFNLYLLTNPYGRLTLERPDKVMAKCTGLTLLISLIFVITFFITSNLTFLIAAMGFGLLMIPAGSMMSPSMDKNKKILVGYSSILLILLIVGLIFGLSTGQPINIFIIFSAIGLFVYQWLVNALIIKK